MSEFPIVLNRDTFDGKKEYEYAKYILEYVPDLSQDVKEKIMGAFPKPLNVLKENDADYMTLIAKNHFGEHGRCLYGSVRCFSSVNGVYEFTGTNPEYSIYYDKFFEKAFPDYTVKCEQFVKEFKNQDVDYKAKNCSYHNELETPEFYTKLNVVKDDELKTITISEELFNQISSGTMMEGYKFAIEDNKLILLDNKYSHKTMLLSD